MLTGPGVLYTCLSGMLRIIEDMTRSLPLGRSSTLVVLSRGSDHDPTLGTGEAAGCTPRSEAMRSVAETISAAQITVHLMTVSETSRSWGLDTLARNTGSLTGLVSWANTGTLARAVGTPARITERHSRLTTRRRLARDGSISGSIGPRSVFAPRPPSRFTRQWLPISGML